MQHYLSWMKMKEEHLKTDYYYIIHNYSCIYIFKKKMKYNIKYNMKMQEH